MISGGVETNPRLRRSRAASMPSPRTSNTALEDESGRDNVHVYKPRGGRDLCGERVQGTTSSAL